MKLLKPLLGVLVAVALLVSAPISASALTDEQTQELISAIDQGDEWILVEPASISNLEALQEARWYSSNYFVVLTEGTLGAYEPQELADFLLSETGSSTYGVVTVIVNEGLNSEVYVATASEELAPQILELFGAPEGATSALMENPGWEFLRLSDELYSLESDYHSSGQASVGIIVGSTFVGIVLLIVIVLVWVHLYETRGYIWRRNRRDRQHRRMDARNKRATEKRQKKEAKQALRDEKERERVEAQRLASLPALPQELSTLTEQLNSSTKLFSESDPELAKNMELMLSRFEELREAIRLMEPSEERANILYVEYRDRFENLVTVIGPKYYQDMKENPSHWRDVSSKLEAIRKSFEATSEQLLENVIQLKEGSEFDFAVAIESLLPFRVNPRSLIES